MAESEYESGRAGSEQSPQTKKARQASSARKKSAASAPKKSESRKMREITEGALVGGKLMAGEHVRDVVLQEKDDDDEDDDQGEVVEFELGDDAIAQKILKRETKKKDAEEKKGEKKVKRNAGELRKKTSVVHVVFEATEEAGVFKCRTSQLPCKKTGHTAIVKSQGGVTSNLPSHVKTWHPELHTVLIKAYNDNKDVEAEFDDFLQKY
jgi:hypothetical protein